MKYIQNNTDKPLSIMILGERTEERIVQTVLDTGTGKTEKVRKPVTFEAPIADLYFPEEVNGNYFPVSLTEQEFKALSARADFQALRQGTRPVLSVVDIPEKVAAKLDTHARAKDINALYSNSQEAIDAHLALLGD